MKKMIVLFLTMMSMAATAHCPNEFNYSDKELCYSYEWLSGPHLGGGHGRGHGHHHGHGMKKPMSSELSVAFWIKGDSTHAPVEIEGLRIYPWMIMDNGMEHGSRPETIKFDANNGVYLVSNIFLMKMMGYWEMRLAIPSDFSDFDPKSDYVSSFIVE